MGYCTQYNLALGKLLSRLGFQVQPVFALRIRSTVRPDWTMGHTWLRVTLDGETRDVCAGAPDNEPGEVSFTPISPVHKGNPANLLLTHLGLIFYAGTLEWKAVLARQPLPGWMFERR
jgi:arylamine N-acetyltransferase